MTSRPRYRKAIGENCIDPDDRGHGKSEVARNSRQAAGFVMPGNTTGLMRLDAPFRVGSKKMYLAKGFEPR